MEEVYCGETSLREDPAAEKDEVEASLYFHGLTPKGMRWFVLKSDSKTPNRNFLRQVFLKNNPNQRCSATAAVGSTLYVFGGVDREHFDYSTSELDAVHFIDTNHPETGWHKGTPMNHGRIDGYAVPVLKKNQIIVFNGREELDGVTDAEAYDLRDRTWHDLGEWKDTVVQYLTSFAVANNGTDILLQSDYSDRIVWYDAEDKVYQLFKRKLCGDNDVESITMMDNIMYIAGFTLPGCVMALDVTRPNAKPQTISGLVGREGIFKMQCNRLSILEVARNKLALVWCCCSGYRIHINHMKIEISKKVKGRRFIFEATSVSPVSTNFINCSFVMQVLPVKTDWEKVDRRNMESRRHQLEKKEKEPVGEAEEQEKEPGKEAETTEKKKKKKKKKKKHSNNNNSRVDHLGWD